MFKNSREYPNDSNGESSLISFVIHVWKEDSVVEERQKNWRGHITPVPNGERYYFKDLSEIPELIVAHLSSQK